MSGVTTDEVRAIVREELKPLAADMARMNKLAAAYDTDIPELKSDVKVLKSDVSELKSDVKVLKDDVSELKTDVAELKTEVTSLAVQFEDMNGKLDSVIEYITDPVKQEREAALYQRVDHLETDMAIVKLALRK